MSPCTTATPAGKSAFEGSRTSARTAAPRFTSCWTTWRPTVPVAPVTRMVMAFTPGLCCETPVDLLFHVQSERRYIWTDRLAGGTLEHGPARPRGLQPGR